MTSTTPPAFLEVQRFRQVWLWLLMAVMFAVVVGAYGSGLYHQLVLGEPWGDRPVSDGALILAALPAFAITIGVMLLLWFAKMVTRVDPGGLSVRFFPFHRRPREIRLEEVVSVEAKTYRPLIEYGGWGLRCRRGGRAYNASGNRGVLLTFKTGKTLLIGSQRARELADAIEAIR